MRRLNVLLLGFVAFVVASLPRGAAADGLEAWMPDDIIGYVKVNDAGSRLEAFLKSDLRRELEALEIVRRARSEESWQKFERQLAEFRSLTGKEPLQVFQEILGKDVLVGVRLGFAGPEVIALTRASSEERLKGTLDAIRQGAEKRAGHPVRGIESTYSGRTIETFGPVSATTLGEVLAVSNSSRALENVIDLAAGKALPSVKSSPTFQKAASAVPAGSLACLVARPMFVPNLFIPEKAENVVGSLIGGGWLGALQASELIAVSLSAAGEELRLSLATVLGERAKDENYWKKFRSFFPDAGAGGEVGRRFEGRGILGMIQLRRDFSDWWANGDSLLLPRGLDEMFQFSQGMSMIFGGRSFKDDVLSQLSPIMTIIARNQEYAGEKPHPSYPGFAAILEMKNPKETGDAFEAAFQTVAGFVNSDRTQKGKEPISLKKETAGGVQMQVMSLPEKGEEAGVAENVSPSLAVVGRHVIISSTRGLARMLAEEAQKPAEGAGAPVAQDSLMVNAEALRAILGDNLDLVVADNMRTKGHTKEQAEAEIKTVLDVLGIFKDLRVSSGKTGDTVELKLLLRVRGSTGAAPTKL